MDDVFNENMGLMHDQHASYNIKQLCKDAKMETLAGIDSTISTKAKSAIATMHDAATTIVDNIKKYIY